MKSIISVGLRQRRSNILWWSIALSLYIILVVTTYPALRGSASQLNQAITSLPPVTKSLLTDSSDFLSPAGYLNSKLLYLILPLLFTVLAVSLGSSLLAREERAGTLELLLARPISRSRILLAKAVVGLIVIATVTAVAIVVTVGFSAVIHLGVSLGAIALAVAMAAVMGTLFGTLAFLLSALGQKSRRMSTGIPVTVALGGYLIASLSSVVTWLKWPAYILPYHYYRPSQILDGTYSYGVMIGFIAVIGILLALAVLGFRRRDIEA